jgi:diaminohydroxyphosphoribosylaminopyrimidine deaminase/5-amino-6-(5-phosphoribosylamino)uracil reductase
MTRALALAERGRGRTTPNPIVGAVVVSADGIVVGQGAHLEAGGRHAEIVALDAAGGRARGATLYCTLEPCCHQGRTGPCVERIVAAGVARAVIAIGDPNPLVGGRGLAFLRAHGIAVTEHVGREAAARQNAPFFTWVTRGRPFVTIKAAVSQDGFVGRREGRVHLTGPRADQFFHQQRAEVDAIAVGSGTVLADDPLLTARGAYRERPLTRIVFDWRGRIAPSARVFSTVDAGPVIMIVSAEVAELAEATEAAEAAELRAAPIAAIERLGVVVHRRHDRRLGPLLEWLAGRQVLSLLVEGGPALQAGFYAEDLVDRVQYAVTPHVLGKGIPVEGAAGRGSEWRRVPPVRMLGDDALIEFDVHRAD